MVSNFGDGDCGAGEIHTRAPAKFRMEPDKKGAPKLKLKSPGLSALPSHRDSSKFRARACVYFARSTIAIATKEAKPC